MLRMLLTAIVKGRVTATVQSITMGAVFIAVGGATVIIALVFGALAVYFVLIPPLGAAVSAAIVCGGLAVIAIIILLWARSQIQSTQPKSLREDFGLPSTGEVGHQMQLAVETAREQARRIGPVKIALLAFGIGMLMGRR